MDSQLGGRMSYQGLSVGTSMVLQWLRFRASNARVAGFDPGPRELGVYNTIQ